MKNNYVCVSTENFIFLQCKLRKITKEDKNQLAHVKYTLKYMLQLIIQLTFL